MCKYLYRKLKILLIETCSLFKNTKVNTKSVLAIEDDSFKNIYECNDHIN